MTNPDQDVTLDEMAHDLTLWMRDKGHWQKDEISTGMMKPPKKKLCINNNDEVWIKVHTSLDVIREVEEALNHAQMKTYLDKLARQLSEKKGIPFSTEDQMIQMMLSGPDTRLQAIYATLKESGEI